MSDYLPERTDLYIALSIIDDARHALCGPGKKIANAEAVLWGEEAARLVRMLGRIKHDASVGRPLTHLLLSERYDESGRS